MPVPCEYHNFPAFFAGLLPSFTIRTCKECKLCLGDAGSVSDQLLDMAHQAILLLSRANSADGIVISDCAAWCCAALPPWCSASGRACFSHCELLKWVMHAHLARRSRGTARFIQEMTRAGSTLKLGPAVVKKLMHILTATDPSAPVQDLPDG